MGCEIISGLHNSRTGSIAGLVYRNGYLYYADWRQNIYRLDLSSGTSTVYYTNPSRTWISDVGFRERADTAGSRPTVGSYIPSIITPTFSTKR